MSVVHAITGASTSDGATFVAKVDSGGPVRVAVSTSAAMTSPTYTASEAVDAQGVAKVSITGLDSSTQYWWQVEDNGTLDTAVTGRFRTAPVAGLATSFTFAASGDAGAGSSGFVTDRVSNHPVFDTIREADPEFFLHMGDMHYRDIGSGVYTSSPYDETDYRDAFDDMLTFNGVEGTDARQQQLYREVPLIPTWDNHDFGFLTGSSVDSDGDLPHKAAARAVFQERMPHYPLPAGSGNVPIYYSFEWGRILFVVLDVRSERSPNSDPDTASKTMLGSAQKTWLDNLLATSTAKALCLVSAGQWITESTESDTWAVYETERTEILGILGAPGGDSTKSWLGRMWMLTASKHSLGLDAGSGNTNGNFPVALFAALDAGGSLVQQNLYDQGPTQPGDGQYGLVTVTDLGTSISVKLSAYHYQDGLWDEIQFGINVPTAAAVASGAVARTIAGSYSPVFEARVVTGRPTGDDPDGTEIDIVDGEVTYDGTAEVRGVLRLDTLGISDATGRSTFPRRVSDLLAPYGAELFVRYGLDLGGAGTSWTPLGYFRIEEPEQSDAPYGVISIDGSDRMAGIIDATLLSPRSYQDDTTLGTVVRDLVADVYPDAVIVWDDTSDQTELGRVLVVEESRYEAIKDIADSQGKIVYWDGEGVLRIESAPDEDDPVWEVRSGRDGVMVSPRRRITRRGVANAIVLVGQAADDQPAVRAVAIDNNPQSPTYFYGDFGQVPRRIESTLVSTTAQATEAAIAALKRSLGAPYQVQFASTVNPTLRPWQAVRVTYRDGNREMHVMQRVTIPLSAGRTMSGTTRTRVIAAIGSIA